MNLIQVDKSFYINPDFITSIELKYCSGGKRGFITMQGNDRQIEVGEKKANEIIKALQMSHE